MSGRSDEDQSTELPPSGDATEMSHMNTPGVIISTPGGGITRLPPLDGSHEYTSLKQKLPPIHGEMISPTRGGRPQYPAADTIISVPEGGGDLPLQTERGMISMPGKPRIDSTRGKGGAIEMIVYLMDKSGIRFSVEDGQTMEAGQLFEYVMEELTLPGEAREVFSLWLVSDLLELQLKPTHVPFKLACYWDELLEKYTSAPEEDIERDEPILMFQRNVFYSRNREKKITNPEILRLLYCEAKENVVDARYPLGDGDYDYLAGLQAHIENQGYIGSKHTASFYKDKVSQYYPPHRTKRKWHLFSKQEQPEDRLSDWHHAASRKLQGQTLSQAYKMYLQFCWKLPYYGAAYFRGQVEHPGEAKIKSVKDDPVYIAINMEGVFVIDLDDTVFLLGLLYEDMKWEYAEPCNREKRDCIPCLFLQFKDVENRESVTKVLQVFSREALLMDAMITTCVDLKKHKKGEDRVDGIGDDDGDGIIKPEGETWVQFNRLSLATFKGSQMIKSNLKRPSTKKKSK